MPHSHSHSFPSSISWSSRILLLSLLLLSNHCQLANFQDSYSSGSDVNCDDQNWQCVCSMGATIQEFSILAAVTESELSLQPDIVRSRFSSYTCLQYQILPEVLQIQPPEEQFPGFWLWKTRLRRRRARRSIPEDDLVPYSRHQYHRNRRRRRVKRQIGLGSPSTEALNNAVANIPARSNHQYIPLGARAELPCQEVLAGGQVQALDGYVQEHVWSHSDGRNVTGADILVDTAGTLILYATSLSDSDIYNCTTYFPENPTLTPLVVKQELDIVVEPNMWLKFSATYSSPTCTPEDRFLIQQHIPHWVKYSACYFCEIRNITLTCLMSADAGASGPGPGLSQSQRTIVIRFSISTLGAELKIPGFAANSQSCPLPCMETMHTVLLGIVRDSLRKLFALNIEMPTPTGGPISLIPAVNFQTAELVMGCPSGFFNNYKLCFPCAAGQYSPDQQTECFSCPIGNYQPTPGSSQCLPCPEGFSTVAEGSTSEADCKRKGFVVLLHQIKNYILGPYKMYSAIALGALIFLILLVCFIPVICPRTYCGRKLACCSCCASDPDFEKLPKKKNSSRNLSKAGSGRKRSFTRIPREEEEDEDETDDELGGEEYSPPSVLTEDMYEFL